MNLVGGSGREISILVDTVDAIDRTVPGGPVMASNDQPNMILNEEAARHINEMLLTGWKTKEDHLIGWASQGVRTGQIDQKIQREQPERRLKGWMCVQTLRVRVGSRTTYMRIMLDRSRLGLEGLHTADHGKECRVHGLC
jgi:hypothetical protein